MNTESWSVVIEGNPPALNDTYKVNYGDKGKRSFYKNSSVTAWQDTVAWLVRQARPRGWEPTRRVRVEITWWTIKKRDADAGIKALLDGIAVGLGTDDSAFLPTVLSNEVDKADPRTIVTIRNES